jgi:hypothetical protein
MCDSAIALTGPTTNSSIVQGGLRSHKATPEPNPYRCRNLRSIGSLELGPRGLTLYGKSWTDISTTGSGFPNDPTLVVYFDQNDITGQTLFAGTSIGILQTTNLGKNWTNLSLNQLPLGPVYRISENANTLTIGTHGRGVWQLQIAAVPQANPTWSARDASGRVRQLVLGGTMTLTNTGSSTESVNSIVLALSQPKLLSQVILISGVNRASVSPSTTSTLTSSSAPRCG